MSKSEYSIDRILKDISHSQTSNIKKNIIKFTKHHVKAALKAASENAKTIEDIYSYSGNTGSEYPPDIIVDKESILNAYNLNKIQ